MSAAAESRVDDETRKKDLTDYRRHEYERSKDKNGSIKTPPANFLEKIWEKQRKKKTKNRETERLKEELLKRGNGEERFWEEMVMDFIEQKCPLEMDRIIRKMSEAAALHHKKFLKYIK